MATIEDLVEECRFYSVDGDSRVLERASIGVATRDQSRTTIDQGWREWLKSKSKIEVNRYATMTAASEVEGEEKLESLGLQTVRA